MKRFRFLFTLVPLISLCTSCMDRMDEDRNQNENYYVEIATVENPKANNNFFLLLDDSTLLWTAKTNFPLYCPKDGQRILANFTLLWDKRETGMYDYDVYLNDYYEVLTKGIFNLTPATRDSIGNDSIHVEDMWVGGNYLNVEFDYRGYNQIHYINLVNDTAKKHTDGKIHLEFRHNANKDTPTFVRTGIVSFRLASLKQDSVKSLNLVIHVNEPNQAAEKLFNLTYNYSTTGKIISEQKKIVLKSRNCIIR